MRQGFGDTHAQPLRFDPHALTSSTLTASTHALTEIPRQHPLRRAQPVGRRGAHVGERREILRESGLRRAHPSPRSNGWPVSARLHRRGAFRTPAMPPKAIRAAVTTAIFHRHVETAARRRKYPDRSASRACSRPAGPAATGTETASTNSPGARPACRSLRKERLQRHLAPRVALAQISTRPQRDQRGRAVADGRASLAMFPPSVAALRTCTEP